MATRYEQATAVHLAGLHIAGILLRPAPMGRWGLDETALRVIT